MNFRMKLIPANFAPMEKHGVEVCQAGVEEKMVRSVPNRRLEWTNLILGAGLFCAAFLFDGQPAAALNAATTGLFIAACSTLALYRYGDWTEWSNIVLGCWSAAAPFILGFGSDQSPVSIHLIVGLCVTTIAIMQLVGSRNAAFVEAKVPRRK